MTFTFVTNYLTHHQLPFCLEMEKLLGKDFKLISTDDMEDERLKMGWKIDCDSYDWYIKMSADTAAAEKMITDSDAVLFGGADDWFLRDRLPAKKLTFRYYERLYKNGRIHAFSPGGYMKNRRRHTAFNDYPVYLLCAGAYVAADFKMLNAYPGKKLKWGYFPEFITYSAEELKRPDRDVLKILWTGRMIDWKHPEMAVYAVKALVNKGYKIHLDMIGEGEIAQYTEKIIKDNKLSGYISLRGFISPKEVRGLMRGSDIYLMTSDYKEGWGAVVNEAMNEGCAIAASAGAGAVPFLIRHRHNGMVFPSGNTDKLAAVLDELCSDASLRSRLGIEAYKTIAGEWNAKEAALRLLNFAESALAGQDKRPENGPLSSAYDIAPSKGYKSCL